MFRGGISQIFRNGSDAFFLIREKNGSSRHLGFCLFFLETFSVILHEKPLGLAGTEFQSVGQTAQGELAVLIEKIFFYNHGV